MSSSLVSILHRMIISLLLVVVHLEWGGSECRFAACFHVFSQIGFRFLQHDVCLVGWFGFAVWEDFRRDWCGEMFRLGFLDFMEHYNLSLT
ncbi:hypothetical protein M758_4G274900 [Ceratodon purpureus]|nr:hypothetical protein M758_4G274900 [Ceratodon purpureus]